ncbi:MAG: hypothetical protein H5T50_06835 [Nitrososphaeria archaeon]|nr:hypothetical protein [Nitrososphaeria archaeon]
MSSTSTPSTKILPKYHQHAIKLLILYTGYTQEEIEALQKLCNQHNITLITDQPINYTRQADAIKFDPKQLKKQLFKIQPLVSKLTYHLQKRISSCIGYNKGDNTRGYTQYNILSNVKGYDHIMFCSSGFGSGAVAVVVEGVPVCHCSKCILFCSGDGG